MGSAAWMFRGRFRALGDERLSSPWSQFPQSSHPRLTENGKARAHKTGLLFRVAIPWAEFRAWTVGGCIHGILRRKFAADVFIWLSASGGRHRRMPR